MGLKPCDAAAIEDCIEELGDSIDELKQCLMQIDGLGNNAYDMRFEMSNIKTWMSAAITDENKCIDGVDEQSQMNPTVRRKIRSGILGVAKLTSDAFCLIDQLPLP
ncbi:hypothetical protein Ancab_008838 [Ancistrocladus abbreviatus]